MPETNFLPNPNYSGYYGPSGNCIHGNCYGSGAPSDGFGNNGFTYIDVDSGDFYVKFGDTWTIQTGGGGSGTDRVFDGSFGNPNGNVTATGAAIYTDDDGSFWRHDSAGTNNTNWVVIIAA